MLKIYNVITRKKEEFIPIEKNVVKMYACGITASGDAHIGHAFQAIVFDMIKKYLSYCGYNVIYVRNYTDIDDKIIVRANQLNVNPLKYAHDIMDKIDHGFSKLCINPQQYNQKLLIVWKI